MRAAILVLILLWSCLAAAVEPPAVLGPGDERVEAPGRRDGQVFVARTCAGELVTPADARRHQPAPWLALQQLLPPPPVHGGNVRMRGAWVFPKPADRAHALSVAARPLEPRAPPPARS